MTSSTDVKDFAVDFLRSACSIIPGHPFAVRLWDDTLLAPEHVDPRFTLVLRTPDTFARFMASADWRTLGEAYLRGEIDVIGDMELVYPLAEHLQATFGDAANPSADPRLPGFASAEPQPHTKARDAEAVEYHYDQSNAVFTQILDPTQNYSSACYYRHDDTLEQAQKNKMDRVCRKIGVKHGDRILDIGCGWGAVLSWVSSHYEGSIEGVTISPAQAEFCRARLEREGHHARARVSICDYRDIDESRPYDKIISLGMVEHVGVANLPTYFAKAFRLLRPGGLFALQGVSSSVTEASTEAHPFTSSYVFPDADMPYLAQYVQAAAEAGFEVRDVENLREHYGWTHRAWRLALESNREAVIAEIGDERYRALRLLYSYSTYYLLRRKCSVYQFVLWKPDGDRPADLPLRREL